MKEITVIRPNELIKKLGISRSSLDRWEKSGSFPKRVHLGANSVGWYANDIEAWLLNRRDIQEKA